eukprot:4566690-Prymnesium_polylepis.1
MYVCGRHCFLRRRSFVFFFLPRHFPRAVKTVNHTVSRSVNACSERTRPSPPSGRRTRPGSPLSPTPARRRASRPRAPTARFPSPPRCPS